MNSPEALQRIFDLEIARLLSEAESNGLDMSGIKKLESLVGAYSKYKDQRLGTQDELAEESTENLLEYLKVGQNPKGKDSRTKDKGSPLEKG